VLRAGPRGEVVTTFGNQLQRQVRTKAIDRSEVLPEQHEERRAGIKSQGIRLIGSVPTPRDRRNRPMTTTAMDAQLLQHGFDRASQADTFSW
jgi:hypothetical protein